VADFGDGGGFNNRDGGGAVMITDSTISGNRASGEGGGFDAGDGNDVTVSRSTISHNTAVTGDGGGFIATNLSTGSSGTVTVTVTQSLISDNRSGANGGGIALESTDDSAPTDRSLSATLTNDTLAANSAAVNGGGLFATHTGVVDSTGSTTATLLNDTIAFNGAASGGGLSSNWTGTGSSLTTVSLKNTIVANSFAGSNFFISGTGASFFDDKNNLSDDNSGAAFLTDPSDFNNTPAKLGPLQNNGGPTFTYALLPGSKAIGAGNNGGAPTTDQRNFPRPGAGQTNVSMGAFEPQFPLGTSANQIFVENLYETLLGRTAAGDPGASGWVNLLNGGASPSAVVLGIEKSSEYLTGVVQGLYQKYLHRAAEATALPGWVGFLASGGTIEQVAEAITSSSEYFQVHGGTNDSFVNALYQDVLGRNPGPGEEAGWLQALNSGVSRQAVAAAFFTSTEYVQNLVLAYYQEFLGRLADAAGLAGWTALQPKQTDQGVLAGILGSSEGFTNRS
jgi:hypothetical protein